MTDRISALRSALAAVVIAALTLAGFGGSLAAGSDVSAAPLSTILGGVHICHTGDAGSPQPGNPADLPHDCCDQCALGGPALLPDAPGLPTVLATPYLSEHLPADLRAPAVARLRTPRQAQGPPFA